jgi:hypothetical protein
VVVARHQLYLVGSASCRGPGTFERRYLGVITARPRMPALA